MYSCFQIRKTYKNRPRNVRDIVENKFIPFFLDTVYEFTTIVSLKILHKLCSRLFGIGLIPVLYKNLKFAFFCSIVWELSGNITYVCSLEYMLLSHLSAYVSF